MPFGTAAVGTLFAFALEQGMVNSDVLAPANFEAVGITGNIDRKTATALGLAADRAVAALIRVGVGAVQAERDRAAMAGAFEMHGGLRWLK
ncbi:hypothetical protein D3C81_2015980 [compost metagenome]